MENYGNKEQLIDILNSMKFPVMGAGGGFAPIGTINFFDASIAPLGWLACDGGIYNIADYPELATFYASVHGASNFYGGDGTTTFAVPDLRGEFLRGTGTNSHTNQGSGANVGVHQDGTEIPFMSIRGATSAIIWSESTMLETKKEDSKLKQGTTVKNVKLTGVDGETGANTNAITTRPTNTSFLICVKATVSGDANGHQYSTEEQVVATWIDGKPIYEKTVIWGALVNGTNEKDVTNWNIDNLIEAVGFIKRSDGEILTIPNYYMMATQGINWLNYVNNKIQFIVQGFNNITDCYVIYKYTKTTD